jgi:hypothetical protein
VAAVILATEGDAMAGGEAKLSRESKTELIIFAGNILKDARADRETRKAVGTVGPDRNYPGRPQAEIDFLADLLDGTIVYFEQDPHTGKIHVTPRAT